MKTDKYYLEMFLYGFIPTVTILIVFYLFKSYLLCMLIGTAFLMNSYRFLRERIIRRIKNKPPTT